jgi:integrase
VELTTGSAEVTAISGLGVIVKRCGCLEPGTRRRLGRRCLRLSERGHGSWYFHCSVTTIFGRRERVRRGGYGTRREAEAARDELLERSRAERTSATWTVARWLRYWLSTRTRIRPSTLRSYTEHVDRHLIPHIGRTRLGELTGRDVAAMFAALSTTDTRFGRPPTPATLHRIRATLRSALNAAIRDGLLRDNPARHIELPTPRRPQPQVWTDNRIEAWRRGEARPSVAVWTARQLAAFFEVVREDRLFAMWWLIALRGLRRGEAAGLRWIDVDLNQRVVVIEQQRIAYGRTVAVGPPKTRASRRTIALDRTTVRLLRAHLHRQRAEAKAAGATWSDTGFVFTAADGAALHPDWITRRFRRLVELSGLPPVRLHDLRHGAATLAHAAGADLKTVQEQLGHTSIVLTADTYTSVLLDLHFKAAEATARLVLQAAARNPGQRYRSKISPPKSAAPGEPTRPEPVRPKRSGTSKRARKGRAPVTHTRHTQIKAA